MSLLITDQELDALEGQPYMLTVLYLYLRRYMDYGSGIVGIKRGISYQSISEALYLEPEAGVKSGSPHRSAIRRATDRLERIGLLRRLGHPDNLVFRMPLAQTDKSISKQADTRPTPHTDTPESAPDKAESIQADMGKNTQADTPPVSGITHTLTTTTQDSYYTGSSSDSLIFPKRTDEITRAGMLRMLKGIHPIDQQELLDELQGCIEKGKVQSVPSALLFGMVQRFKTGGFNPVYAARVKASRDSPRESVTGLKPLPEKTSKQAGRAAMSNVRQIFNKQGKP